jgi:hypothetical protein
MFLRFFFRLPAPPAPPAPPPAPPPRRCWSTSDARLAVTAPLETEECFFFLEGVDDGGPAAKHRRALSELRREAQQNQEHNQALLVMIAARYEARLEARGL